MTSRTTQISPQVYARIGGVLYLIIIVIGFCGEFFVRNRLVVSGDAAATANNILASEFRWRISIAGDLIIHVCDIGVMLALYVLLRPVNKNLALLAMLFNLIQTAVLVAFELPLFVALFLAGSADYLKAFDPHQLQALAYLCVKSYDYGLSIGLIFFGFTCLTNGYLLFKSGYFPRPLGVLMTIAGLSYLTNSFTLILAPTFAATIFAVLVLALIGELSLSLWLVIKGVNTQRWDEQVDAGATSRS